MTCIVAVRHKGGVTMGADSRMSNSWFGVAGRKRKIIRGASWLIGSCGSIRGANILTKPGVIPEPPKKPAAVIRWAMHEMIPVIRKEMKDGGAAKVENSVEEGIVFLMATRGVLFEVQADYSVVEWAGHFASAGSGRGVALGALHATARIAPRRRVLMALRAASAFDPYVRAPYQVEELPR